VKVLHIAPGYPHSKLYPQLISALEDTGCENCVYVQSKGVETFNPYPIYYLGRDFGLIDRLLYFRKQHIIANDIIERDILRGVDVVHAHNLFSAGYNAYRIWKRYHIPYIVAVRNTDVNDFFHYMIHLRSIGVKIMREAAAVIFLSPSYRDVVLNTYVPPRQRETILSKCHIIPNGLDPFFLNNCAKVPRHIEGPDRIRLIYVGDIDKNKNVGTTIKACDILRKEGVNVSFTVMGTIRDGQEEVIKDIEYLHYYPFSPKEKVLECLRQADIFVMPSIHETFGLVYIEAMSQGLPVIYTEGQGFDGYYAEGTVGYHVPCFDDKAIAKNIRKIMDNYEYISNNCINAVGTFSWFKKAEDYFKLYRNVIDDIKE
jgi:Glycosyltransferase